MHIYHISTQSLPVFISNTETERFLSYLLISVNSQTGTGNRKLDNEHHKQDNHILSISVKEQQQIMVLPVSDITPQYMSRISVLEVESPCMADYCVKHDAASALIAHAYMNGKWIFQNTEVNCDRVISIDSSSLYLLKTRFYSVSAGPPVAEIP